jgi:hypothetical protein
MKTKNTVWKKTEIIIFKLSKNVYLIKWKIKW